jgi:mRNA interferase RelE/StbE
VKVFRTESFKRDFQRLPAEVQGRTEKTVRLLAENPRHPSLRAKKMKGLEDTWEASVSLTYRITYQTSSDSLLLRRIGTHDVLKKQSR